MRKSFASLLLMSALSVAGMSFASGRSAQTVAGTWTFYVTLPGANSPKYMGTRILKADGTIAGSPIDQHSGASYGVWERTGPRDFSFTFVADSYDSQGNFTNTNRIRGTLTLSADGNSASGRTLLDRLDKSGKVTFTGPATYVAHRLTVLHLAN